MHAPATTPVPPAWKVVTFGGLSVERQGTPVEWTARSARDLFAALLASPDGVRRETLLEDLWGLAPSPAADNRFRVTAHRLRATLGSPDSVQERGGRVRLSPDLLAAADFSLLHAALNAPPAAPDARLRTLDAALALYAGDFLPDDILDRVQVARDAHRGAYARLSVERSVLACDAHACRDTVDALVHALRADPYLGEQHHQQLMTCLTVTDDRYAATEHYRRFVRFLREELGDTPMPETVALAARIKCGEQICERRPGQHGAPPCPFLPQR